MPPWIAQLGLAWPLAKRDIMARYRGSLVGVAWALLAPLAMVGVYTLVFRGVFQARWGVAGTGADGYGYVLRLFVGLTVFSSVAEVATRATRLMQDNANLVKRVVFPLELLCVALLMQVAVHTLLQLALLALMTLVLGEGARLSWGWVPVAFVWLLALQFTAALALSALGTYLRDLQHLIPVAMTGLMFLSPIFFPSSAAPPILSAILAFNPLSAPIEFFRMAWFGDVIDTELAVVHAAALVLALLAARWMFARLRPGFADLV